MVGLRIKYLAFCMLEVEAWLGIKLDEWDNFPFLQGLISCSRLSFTSQLA